MEDCCLEIYGIESNRKLSNCTFRTSTNQFRLANKFSIYIHI